MKLMHALVLVGCIYSLGMGVATAEEIEQIDPLTPIQQEGVRRFFEDVLGIELEAAVPTSNEKAPSRVTRRPRNPYRNVIVHPREGGEGIRIRVEIESGLVTWYNRPGGPEDEPEAMGLDVADAISEEDASQRVLPILEYYGLPTESSDHQLIFDASRDPDSDELRMYSWLVSEQFSYEGLPCRGSGLRIQLSACTGEVWLVSYYPVILPIALQTLVDRSAAVAAANNWVGERPFFEGKETIFSDDVEARTKMVIAAPNGSYLSREVRKARADAMQGTLKTYRCWEVPFSFVYRDVEFNVSALVRIDTGDVIGAYKNYIQEPPAILAVDEG
jgi:hypothetical protein